MRELSHKILNETSVAIRRRPRLSNRTNQVGLGASKYVVSRRKAPSLNLSSLCLAANVSYCVTMSQLALVSWVATLVVAVLGATLRSRTYGIFRGVILSIYTLIALAIAPAVQGLVIAFDERALWLLQYAHMTVYVDSLFLIRPRMRAFWYRPLISYPAMYLLASVLLSLPWALLAPFGVPLYGVWLPFACCLFGFVQSVTTRTEQHSVVVGNVEKISGVSRLALVKGKGNAPNDSKKVLRIVQITDPHLGPFMSVARLRKICERAVAQEPDLILLTGDFLTMESQARVEWLIDALEPLKNYSGRTFACLGNHDHEAITVVKQALADVGVALLVDDSTVVSTPAGKVQIVGYDFHFTRRAERTQQMEREHPRMAGALRLILLHDPGAFRHLSDGDADLVLSGHTHGGQVGLVSLGLPWTMVYALAKVPDHSLWAQGSNRMYVHRGTGHYGFPLRLGVSAEESVLSVYRT